MPKYPHQLLVRISEATFKRLAKVAKAKGTSIAELVRDLIAGLK
jgi:hypothetical protein